MTIAWHLPVMPEEVLEYLISNKDGSYIDVTLGGGGHSELILKRVSSKARLLGIDRDLEAIQYAEKKLKLFGKQIKIKHGVFSDVSSISKQAGFDLVDGILIDLGVSTYQLTTGERGFSFKNDGPLDMRMNKDSSLTAKDLIDNVDEKTLADIIFNFGEERYSRKIAKRIKELKNKINTTKDLADIVRSVFPPNQRNKKIHPATRTFQALRIYINDELGELGKFLKDAPLLLEKGGVLVVISYHSLEDRMVKRSFKELAKNGGFKIITKKVIIPTKEEIFKNPKSRSAKMRVIKREM